ncbi:hypothetical protein GOODEAATRI_017630 [Goodea atripinnis]|uniref:Uncharacterized protein n=1 Tax=Goodea atripinnis TaxID=208336 RepID=A0ABV0NVM1_9TELE
MENGTVWSNSSESSDDSSSPALAHHTQRLTASNLLQTTPTTQLCLAPHKSSVSTPSLSSNQEEDETEGVDIFPQPEAVPNGHLQASCSDCGAADRVFVQSEDIISETSAELSSSCTNESPVLLVERVNVSAADVKTEPCEESSTEQTEAEAEEITAEAAERLQETQSEAHRPVQDTKLTEDAPTDLGQVEIPEDKEERSGENGDGPHELEALRMFHSTLRQTTSIVTMGFVLVFCLVYQEKMNLWAAALAASYFLG